MNFLTVPLGATAPLDVGGVAVPLPDSARGGRDRLVVGVRPESLELAADGIGAEVQVVEDIGADAYVFCTTSVDGEERRLVARSSIRRAPGARGARGAAAGGRGGAPLRPGERRPAD